MYLCNGKAGNEYKVRDIDLPTNMEKRLEALGMTRGTSVMVLNSKSHGVLIVKVRGTRFALGRNITKNILVIASILMWIILNFGPQGYITEMADSFGAILGHWLVPFFEPIGLGFWQIAVALIAGISAKEVVVSSCAVLFGIPNINSAAGMNTLVGILGNAGFGQLNAFCLMIFCLLYIPCMAALATIRRESRSIRWMLFSAVFQLAVAWLVTFLVYQVGSLL